MSAVWMGRQHHIAGALPNAAVHTSPSCRDSSRHHHSLEASWAWMQSELATWRGMRRPPLLLAKGGGSV